MPVTYTRVSTTASGGQANSDSYSATVSPDGASVAFYSYADNLVAGDTNTTYDIFLKTLATGAVTRLSTTATGVQANGQSIVPVFSPDGARVAFSSLATNLVAGDTNGVADIFVKTLATGAVVRVSTDAAGNQADGVSSAVIFSPDGTKVAFLSAATNLVAGDTNGYPDLFVKDLGTGAVTRIALTYTAGSAGTGALAFAPDGARVAVTNGGALYLVDLATGASTPIATRGDGSPADGGNTGQPVFSPDGTKIAFQSDATFLVAGDTNGTQDIFVKDLTTGAVSRVSTSATGVQANSLSRDVHFSPDGTQVVFITFSDTLVAGTVLGATSIVVKDLTTGVVTLVAEINVQNKFDGGPQFTPDGRSIVFSTPGSLVANDGNGVSDIYLAALPAPPAGAITFTSGATATTPESTATSTVVYTAQATDSVAGQAVTYILSGGPDAGLFNINATTGAVTFKSSPDFEAPIDGGHSNLYRIIVTATDGVRATGRPVTLSVTDLNDNAPVFNSATVATVASGLAAGATAYTAHAVDADVSNTVTYSLAGGADAAKFNINGATGALSFKVAPSYAAPDDAGADHAYDLVVRASDGVAAHDALRTVRITVADPAAQPVVGAPTPVASVSLVSTNAAGLQGDAFSGVLGSSDAALSADGTKIAFVSWSDNLVSGDTNGTSDVFVKTLSSGAIVRVSTDSSGGQVSSFPQSPVFSLDGGRVLYTNYGAVFSGSFQGDVALKDLGTGALTLVSSDASAVLGVPGAASGSFSADGARVIFSAGSNSVGNGAQSLVPGDTNLAGDIYIKTLATGNVVRVSNSAAGEIGDGQSLTPVLSPDGTKAAFATDATNLFPGDSNGHRDIVIKDLATGAVTQVSVNADGVGGNGDSTTPVFSPDGSKVAFVSAATNLVAGDTNGAVDVFVKDLATGVVTRVSTGSAGEQGNGGSYRPLFSADGTKLLFTSLASNLSSRDGNGAFDAFVKDLRTGGLTLVSVDATGASANAASLGDAISADGSRVLLESEASNLAAGDLNGVSDVFLARLAFPAVAGVVTFTSGGTATAPENTAPTTVVYTARAVDTDPTRTLTYSLSGADAGRFDLDAATGALTFKAAPDFENPADAGANNTYDLLVTATDGSASATLAVAVGVTNVNDNAPVFTSAASTTVGSGMPVAAPAYTARAVDADAGDTVAYSLSGGPDAAKFNIDPVTGVVTFKVSPSYAAPDDAGADHVYDIVVKASDGLASHDATQAVAITVANPMGATSAVSAVRIVDTSAAGVLGDRGVADIPAVSPDGIHAAFSPDGSKVVFTSFSTNLVPGDVNGGADIFVKTLATGAIALVSTSAAGVQGNSGSYEGVFSPDGTKVAFDSLATNLVAGDTNGVADVFVKDLATGVVTRISLDGAGAQLTSNSSLPVFSPDGTKVAFLVGSGGIQIKDLVTGALTRVNGGDGYVFSPDGTKISFSASSSLVAGSPTQFVSDIYIQDIATGSVSVVSTDAAGARAAGSSAFQSFSPDGTRVVFSSGAANLVAGDGNGAYDIFVKTLATGAITRISTTSAGVEANGASFYPVFSPDGTQVAFLSDATNLVAGDVNGKRDVFVKNLVTGAVSLVSTNVTGGQADNSSSNTLTFSPDGKSILFNSAADNLVPGDTNGAVDVFLVTLAASGPVSPANTPPTLSGTVANQADAAGRPIGLFAQVTVADPDAGQTETVTVSFAAANGTLAGGGFTGANGVYTGSFASAAAAQAGLRALSFTPTAGVSATTAFTVSVSDGQAAATDSTTSVIATAAPVAPANTPPTISGAVAGQADIAGTPISPFAAVTVTDPDTGQTETVTVSFAAANGTLAGGGFVQTAPGVYTVAAASAAAAQAALRGLSFTPVAGVSATTAFTVSVNDGQATATDSATSVVATYTPPAGGGGGGGGAVTAPASVRSGLLTQFQNLERALASGADALNPATPLYAAFQAYRAVAAQLDGGQIGLAQAESALAHLVDGTTAVAVASYAFFTGYTPTAAGLNYLVHSGANATDLNDAYYARFSTENRYINFAANLATGAGAGATAFQAAYGSLSLADATARAYAAVFGTAADAAKVSALLNTLVPDGLGGQETRAQYFAQYGGDGPNGQGTKAAMIGFLLSNAVHDGSGVYGAATEHYLAALAHGSAPAMGSELALAYGSAVTLVGTAPVADPSVTG